MRRPAYRIPLEQVVWLYPVHQKPAAETDQGFLIIVDTSEEHALVHCRYPHINEGSYCGERIRRELLRMVELRHEIHGGTVLVLPYDSHQLRRESLRADGSCPCAEPEDHGRADRAEDRQHHVDMAVGEGEHIASGQEDLGNERMAGDVLCGLPYLILICRSCKGS